jgi:hypothetical protein
MREHRPAPLSRTPARERSTEWRCHRCDRLLGIVRGGRLHLRFARRYDYTVALPALCTCPDIRCLAANDIAASDDGSGRTLAGVG